MRDNDPASAAVYAQRGLESEHNNPYLYQYLGSAFLEEGDDLMADPPARMSAYEAAITAFEHAQVLAPQDKTFPLALGSLYDLLGRFGEAEWMFDKAVALDPKSIPTRQVYDAHLKNWQEGKTESVPDSR